MASNSCIKVDDWPSDIASDWEYSGATGRQI